MTYQELLKGLPMERLTEIDSDLVRTISKYESHGQIFIANMCRGNLADVRAEIEKRIRKGPPT